MATWNTKVKMLQNLTEFIKIYEIRYYHYNMWYMSKRRNFSNPRFGLSVPKIQICKGTNHPLQRKNGKIKEIHPDSND